MAVYGTDFTSVKKQVLQVAAETTQGVLPSSGWLKLHGLNLDIDTEFEAEIEAAKGARFATNQTLKKDLAKAAIGGKPDFNELDIPLSSVLCKPTISGSSPAFTRVYELLNVAAVSEARQTYAVQYGDSYQCESYTGGLLADFQLTFDREGGITQGGNMMLGALDLTQTLKTGAAEIAKAAMMARSVDVWVADAPSGLGEAGNKVVLPWVYTWGINGRAAEYWALNSAYPGPAMYDEGEDQGFAGNLKVPTVYGLPKFLEKIRQGQLIYVRVEAKGKKLATGTPDVYELLRIDQCWFVQSIPTDNYKGAYSKNVNLVGAQSDDASWAKSVCVTLINGIAGS